MEKLSPSCPFPLCTEFLNVTDDFKDPNFTLYKFTGKKNLLTEYLIVRLAPWMFMAGGLG